MPLLQPRENLPLPEPKAKPKISGSVETLVATASPARLLQERLERHAALSPTPGIQKWSQRRALTFIVTSSAALWMAILVAGAQAVKVIA